MKTFDQHIVNKLRRMCLNLPESYESKTFGHVTFRIKKKTFAVFEHYHGSPCVTFKMTKHGQKLALQDARFFIAPYVGQHGWVCRSTEDIDWIELAEQIVESYILVAPKRLAAGLDRNKLVSTLQGLDI